ncbi:MAG: hypothetical protein J6A95_01400 [Clostridia bacterium]|nr:hypothetical protein [Clostridia bacterium]
MSEQEILKLKKCVIKDTKKTSINISVFIVARACFNDERLIEDLKIRVEDIKDKDLYWFDLFLGRKKDNKTKVAVAYIEGSDVYLLQDDGEKTEVVKANYILASEDYDKSSLIATHIW